MQYNSGYPTEEGFYLTTYKNSYKNTFSIPKVLKFVFKRIRSTNQHVLDENGNYVGCWVDLDNSGAYADFYCNLPENPNLKLFDIKMDIEELLDIRTLSKLTDSEIKTIIAMGDIEDIDDLIDDGILGELKAYIYSDKKDLSMVDKFNHLKDRLRIVVCNRWLSIIG